VPDAGTTIGLIDTSVVIGLEHIDPRTLPEQLAVAAITLAELAAAPHATNDARERAQRLPARRRRHRADRSPRRGPAPDRNARRGPPDHIAS
jgi:predicted nucleic acid-binding protein